MRPSIWEMLKLEWRLGSVPKRLHDRLREEDAEAARKVARDMSVGAEDTERLEQTPTLRLPRA